MRRTLPNHRGLTTWIGLLFVLLTTGIAHGDLRSGDELWLVSTRFLGHPGTEPTRPDFVVYRYDTARGWHSSDLATFLAGDDGQTLTTVFIDGYNVDWQWSQTRGWEFYHTVVAGPDTPPMRFVIWSWPSETSQFLFTDLVVKSHRADVDGVYLASFLTQLQSRTPVSLIGYSYGARIITGALHVTGGGKLGGLSLARPKPRQTRVVLMAAAVHSDWLLPGHVQDQALGQTDRLLLLFNSADPVLKRYGFVDRVAKPQALGFTGQPSPEFLGEQAWKLRQMNVYLAVGAKHALEPYQAADEAMAALRSCVFWQAMP